MEVQGSNFQDTRLHRRFAILLEKLWAGMGQTISFACQDWASTKAAYRFLSNDRVSGSIRNSWVIRAPARHATGLTSRAY
ncbi:IS4/Tn5 family transposase DNA-binding protein [Paraburkholderia humisilvae]|uniref:IS4/Tn5 family transposase DNA-binding protein n=1 Tax=Paraburkholderia humisilvae TaxID=627669 RepID=UPI0035E59319